MKEVKFTKTKSSNSFDRFPFGISEDILTDSVLKRRTWWSSHFMIIFSQISSIHVQSTLWHQLPSHEWLPPRSKCKNVMNIITIMILRCPLWIQTIQNSNISSETTIFQSLVARVKLSPCERQIASIRRSFLKIFKISFMSSSMTIYLLMGFYIYCFASYHLTCSTQTWNCGTPAKLNIDLFILIFYSFFIFS